MDAEPPRSSGPSDADLLAAHVAGDPDAFAELFRRHRDRLWAVALRTCGHREDAADALQDALVSAYRRADGFRGDSAVTTWLHRIVVNACLDRLRATRARRTEALPDDLEEYGARRADARGVEPGIEDPAELSVRDDRRRRVVAALATLPDEQRAAIVLVDLEGHSVAEAADILGCAPGTVKSRCSRGRARLLPLLEGLREDAGQSPPATGNHPSDAAVPSADAARAPPA
ncbi:RNA polymerase sigma factor SigM [Nocardioides sp. TRM66260-LWL]|uniref:RNA polymerase sigma factor SigM n=1 Tax=Nocardioides sp. TRM66260-LWL TaxID=2874478 RepID=UPI001CC53B60|nr:RNA polymerase sigma factor SigM [Nocardioides sp. TRM66260-LWL]MBZ5735568.1 RNA polymerase sigma factor SigM [Nocardioides sp. TRM66260-LWL]